MTGQTSYAFDEVAMLAGIAAWYREKQPAPPAKPVSRRMAASMGRLRMEVPRRQAEQLLAKHAERQARFRADEAKVAAAAGKKAERARRRQVSARRMGQIVDAVAKGFGLSGETLLARTNAWAVVHPRGVAVLLIRELTGAPITQLGRFFGKHHTTMLAAVEATRCRMAEDVELRAKVDALRAQLAGKAGA